MKSTKKIINQGRNTNIENGVTCGEKVREKIEFRTKVSGDQKRRRENRVMKRREQVTAENKEKN